MSARPHRYPSIPKSSLGGPLVTACDPLKLWILIGRKWLDFSALLFRASALIYVHTLSLGL